MSIDPKIRLVTICDINGKMMYSDYRVCIISVIISLSSVKSQSVSLGDAFITSNIAVLLRNRYLIVVVDFDEISSKLTIKSSKLPATDLGFFLKGWIGCKILQIEAI